MRFPALMALEKITSFSMSSADLFFGSSIVRPYYFLQIWQFESDYPRNSVSKLVPKTKIRIFANPMKRSLKNDQQSSYQTESGAGDICILPRRRT
jgi:hypothetical protein